VDLNHARDFLRTHHRAVLATARRDGRPQLSPVLAAVDGEGRVLISTREGAIKARNARRDPHVSLCVFNDGFFGEWVQAEGSAEIVSLPAAMELLIDYYQRVAGEHPDWADYRAAMEHDKRVIMRITITHAGPDISG
jgi:PPOX class probable F420-dependent enzyme